MKTLLLLPLLALVMACNSSNDEKHDGNDALDKPAAKQVNTTPYTDCDRGTPTEDIRGTWWQSFEQNGMQFRMVFEFDDNSVRLTNECSINDRSLQASVVSAATYTENKISVLQSDSDEKSIREEKFKMNCSVSISPDQVEYSFKGSCLVLKSKNAKDPMTFVPAR
ncbi:MAG: hypothetical protein ACXWC9_01725 [Pseudobdellovibrionaceae bacterium]